MSIQVSCSSSRIWGLEKEELVSAIHNNDLSFIQTIHPSQYKKVVSLGYGYSFIIGKILWEKGLQTEAFSFYKIGADNEAWPINQLCLEEIVLNEENSEERLKYLLNLEKIYADIGFTRLNPLFTEDQISSIRKEIALAMEDLTNKQPLPEFDLQLRQAQQYLNEKKYQASWELFKVLVEDNLQVPLSRSFASDFLKAALYGGSSETFDFVVKKESLFLEKCKTTEEKQMVSFLFNFYLGRIRQKNNGADSRLYFEKAINIAPTELDRDSAIWYFLDTLRLQELAFIDKLATTAPLWHDSVWYDDILDTFIVSLVQAKKWKSLENLKKALNGKGSSYTEARLAYILARTGGGGGYSEQQTRELFEQAYKLDTSSLYYRLLAAKALGYSVETIQSLYDSNTKRLDSEIALSIQDSVFADSFLYEMIESNLYSDAYKLLSRLVYFSDKQAIVISDFFSNKGKPDLALRTAIMGFSKADSSMTKELLERIYPRPWLEDVQKQGELFKIQENLLYALIRSESYFKVDAYSQAGAYGLAQLMSTTAGDIARKLKISDFSLLDPEINIQFGSFYLAELISRLDGQVLEALFAYNAGITRVRTWKKNSGNLPLDLFLEQIPFAETRDYGRKLLVASVFYGVLYNNMSIADSIHEIFGDL